MNKKTFLLCILDGFGLTENKTNNPIELADTPFLDRLFKDYPNSKLFTDGAHVGLPDGQMGNSEVGHTTIGSGRVIKQSLEKITQDLTKKKFQDIDTYKDFIAKSKDSRAIHLIGLVSDGGVHSHGLHTLELCKLLNNIGKIIYLHVITDGRDTDPSAGKEYLEELENNLIDLKNVHLATVIGRFYAMDRDKRWERLSKSWSLLIEGKGEKFSNVSDLFASSYKKDIFDEFIEPSILTISDELDAKIQDNDAVFLFNFRADRMRQLTDMLIGTDIDGFNYDKINLKAISSMTSYDEKFDDVVGVIYPKENLQDTLGEVISNAGMTQLRIAETEKYPHVTYYLNGGREAMYKGENRILVKSPRDVESYDEKPEMSLPEVTDKLVNAIKSGEYDFIALNIANGDMVGHCGKIDAAIKAIEAIDLSLSNILPAINGVEGQVLIIADHGNVEEMLQSDGRASTSHSTNPVPCIYYSQNKASIKDGSLADVAPTILKLMNLDIPSKMTGNALIKKVL